MLTWLATLLLFVSAQGAWADNTNPKVTIASGPTYGTSAESTSLTLRVWFWNYDGDNAHFSGDVYLTIDGTQTVKLNGMWGTFCTSNEDDVKGKSGSGTYGSQGTITLDGTTVGTAQFKNLQKKQEGGSANNGKYNTIDLVLSFNEKFSFYGHTIGVKGTWNDYCDGGSQGSVSKHLTVTIPGFPRAKSVTLSRSADKLNPVTVSWSSETYNSSANTTGMWYIYRNGTLLGTTNYDTKTYTDNSIPATIGSTNYSYTVSYCPPKTTISSTRPAGLYSSSASFTIGIYSLSLADGISVTSGDVVTTSGGANYYIAGVQLALGFDTSILADDQSFDHYVVNGTAITGNSFAMPWSNTTVTASLTDLWGSLSGADGSAAHPYLISSTAGLDLLATKVNSGKDYSGKYFKLTTNLTYSGTNNYTAIGTSSSKFYGTFDGGGFTISGINISQASTYYQGLFGDLGSGAVVKDVNLTNSVILGYVNSGGIVGRNYGTVSGCTVASTVQVQATNSNAYYHGGIVGNNYGTVSGCTSSAQLTCSSTGRHYGGIVGRNYGGTVSGNFAIGSTVPSVTYNGAIVGYESGGTLSNNYYYNCTVAGQSNATGKGCNGADVTDNNGAVSVHTLTLAQGVSTSTSASKTYNGTNYYAKGTKVELSYSGTVPEGSVSVFKVNGEAIEGNTFTMPTGDVTVTATFEDVWGVTANADGSADHPYIITTTAGLDLLAEKVNAGNDYANTYFQLGADITYDKTVENNYTAIGKSSNLFKGTFDGMGWTISGINISQASTSYQGLFGHIGYGAVVKDVNLTNSVILGYGCCGGIAGCNVRGTVSGCTVASTVQVQAANSNAYYHGGIVGNNYGTVSGCTSSAQLTYAGRYYGGIVGYNNGGTVSDNFAIGATVPSETIHFGAILGYEDEGSLSNNYYYNCTVAGQSNATGIGCEGADVTDDNGAVSVYTITLGEGVAVASSASKTYNGTNYYAQGTTVELGGLSVNDNELGWYTVNGSKIEGSSFKMPAQNATVGTAKETLYTITLGNGISVTTSASKTYNGTNYYANGTTVELSYSGTVPEGYVFGGYKVNGEAIEGNTFTMPAADVTISVTFAEKMPYIVDLTGNEPVSLFAGQSSGEIEIVFMGLMGYASAVDLTTGKTFPYADYYMKMVSAGDGAESEAMNYAFCFDLNLDGVNDMMLQKTSDNAYTMSRISAGADKLTSDYTFLWTEFESVMSSRTFELAFGQSPTSGITFRFGEEFESEELDFRLPLDNNSENNEMFLTAIMARFNRYAVDEVSVENSITYDVILKDRTLWCDGDWNTLCLPFEVDLNDKDCPLANATARTLESASLSDDGIHLVLNFGQPVEKLEAGVPYIIKWKSSANNIVNPVFKNVAIDFDYNIFYSDDDRVQFRGNWEKLTFDEERQNILMLGAENQLFWPDGTAPSVLGACRAYFFLPEPGVCAAQIRSFELNFEGESETAIANLKPERDDDSCYTLDGRKVNQQGKGGITILRGKKVLNK